MWPGSGSDEPLPLIHRAGPLRALRSAKSWRIRGQKSNEVEKRAEGFLSTPMPEAEIDRLAEAALASLRGTWAATHVT